MPPALQPVLAQYRQTFSAAAQVAGVELPTGATLKQLIPVWAGSEFVARACIREPRLLTELANSGDLASRYAPGDWMVRLERCLPPSRPSPTRGEGVRMTPNSLLRCAGFAAGRWCGLPGAIWPGWLI